MKLFDRTTRVRVITYTRLSIAAALLVAFIFALGMAWTLNYVHNLPGRPAAVCK